MFYFSYNSFVSGSMCLHNLCNSADCNYYLLCTHTHTASLYPLRYHAKAPPTPRTPSQRPRDKIDRYQMLQRTRKAWQALPEVRWRVVQEQRRREAETNRLRAKLYQKVNTTHVCILCYLCSTTIAMAAILV